jgi:hypothetical protein
METKEIIKYLETQGVPKDQTEELAQMLEKVNPVLYNAFRAYVKEGTEPDICIEGYTCRGLMKELGLSITGALLTMDWLIREPENAKKAIEEGIK